MKGILLVFIMAAAGGSVLAADITGSWTARLPARDDIVRELTVRFKQSGGRLTGSMGGPDGSGTPISEGTISGDRFSFAVAGPRGKMICKGVFSAGELRVTQYREGSPELSREIIFKRQ